MTEVEESVVNTGAWRTSVGFVDNGTWLEVMGLDMWGERINGNVNIEHLKAGEGIRAIVEGLSRIERGRELVEQCNQFCDSYYRELVARLKNGGLLQEAWYEDLSILRENFVAALNGVFDQGVLEDNECVIRVVKEAILSMGLAKARVNLIEEQRCLLGNDQAFSHEVSTILDVFASEAMYLSPLGNLLFSQDLSFTQAYKDSWELSRFSKACNLGSVGEYALKRYFITKEHRLLHITHCATLGFIPALASPLTFLGPSGSGKTTVGRMLAGAERSLGKSVLLNDGGDILENFERLRERHLESLVRAGASHLQGGYSQEQVRRYVQFMQYRFVLSDELYFNWLERTKGLPPSRSDLCIFESMAFDPFSAILGVEGVDPFLRGRRFVRVQGHNPVEAADLYSDLGGRAVVRLDEYFPKQEEIGRIEQVSARDTIEGAIHSSKYLLRTENAGLATTVVIDLPTEACIPHVQNSGCSEEEIAARLKMVELFQSWRAIHLVLAEIFPNIDVVHAAVDNELEDCGYTVLSAYKVACLSDIVRTFLNIKSLVSEDFISLAYVSRMLHESMCRMRIMYESS